MLSEVFSWRIVGSWESAKSHLKILWKIPDIKNMCDNSWMLLLRLCLFSLIYEYVQKIAKKYHGWFLFKEIKRKRRFLNLQIEIALYSLLPWISTLYHFRNIWVWRKSFKFFNHLLSHPFPLCCDNFKYFLNLISLNVSEFREGEVSILVATDVAARGLGKTFLLIFF